MNKGYTLPEVMVGILLISLALILIIQFIILYNEILRTVKQVKEIAEQANTLSGRIKNVINAKPSEKLEFFPNDNNLIIKRKDIQTLKTIAAIGLYSNQNHYTDNHYFINDSLKKYKISHPIYPEYAILEYNSFKYVILGIYGDIRLSSRSTPKKTQFSIFVFKIE
ncbi:MAG: prepilin-type N-terminal cleavage/methylation domain-containing protein [bacterium]